MSETPQHEHDCDTCVFLGREGDYDLYFHDGGDLPVLTTVVARYGSEGDYFSGLLAAQTQPPLREALRRAEASHLFTTEVTS